MSFIETPDLDTMQNGSSLLADDGSATGMMSELGAPHLTLLGMLVIILALRFLGDEELFTRVFILRFIRQGLEVSTFILLFKVASGALVRNGVVVPGLTDTAVAL